MKDFADFLAVLRPFPRLLRACDAFGIIGSHTGKGSTQLTIRI